MVDNNISHRFREFGRKDTTNQRRSDRTQLCHRKDWL